MSKTFTVMKRSLLGLSLLLFSLMSLFSAEAKKPVTDPRQAAIVEKMLDSRDYWIAVTSVYPLKQRSFTVSGYTIHVCGDTLQTVLPYVGQSYRAPLGADEGMSFNDAPITNYREKNEAGQLGDYFFRPDEYRVVLVHVPHRTERPDERFPRSRELREHHLQRRSICPKRSGFLIARGFSGCGIVFVARPHAGSYRRSGAAFPVSLACRRANHSVFRLCALLYRPSSSRCFRA